jgi:hypothetical protein
MLANLELFTALKAAGVDDGKAEAAAALFHAHECRLTRIEQIIGLTKWGLRVLGASIVVGALLWRVFPCGDAASAKSALFHERDGRRIYRWKTIAVDGA